MPFFDSDAETQVGYLETNITGSGTEKNAVLLAGVTPTNTASFLLTSENGRLFISGAVETNANPSSIQKIRIQDGLSGSLARVDSSGRLSVSVVPPTSPPETTPLIVAIQDAVATTTDNVYIIPDGQTIRLQRFAGGGESSNGASVIELFYDPNGNATGMQLIRAGYVFGNNFEFTLNPDSLTFTGNGTRVIRARRRRLAGGSAELAAFWDGYLE